MPTIETSIWLALKARAQALTLSPVLPVALPNESFTKPSGRHLRVTHIPNVNRQLFLGSTDPHQRIGLLQIDVFGKKNENAAVVVEIAGNVAAQFACGTGMWRDGLRVSVAKARPVAARATCPESAAQATPCAGRCAPPFGRTPDQNGVSDGNTIIVADIVRNA